MGWWYLDNFPRILLAAELDMAYNENVMERFSRSTTRDRWPLVVHSRPSAGPFHNSQGPALPVVYLHPYLRAFGPVRPQSSRPETNGQSAIQAGLSPSLLGNGVPRKHGKAASFLLR